MGQKYHSHLDNRVALPLDDSNAESLLITQPVPRNKKEARAMHKVSALRHFTMEKRMGFPDLFHCWCGESIAIDYMADYDAHKATVYESMDAMTARLSAFCREHSECEPLSNMQQERDTGGSDE